MLMDEQNEEADMDEEIEELLLRNTMAIDEMKATLKDLNLWYLTFLYIII